MKKIHILVCPLSHSCLGEAISETRFISSFHIGEGNDKDDINNSEDDYNDNVYKNDDGDGDLESEAISETRFISSFYTGEAGDSIWGSGVSQRRAKEVLMKRPLKCSTFWIYFSPKYHEINFNSRNNDLFMAQPRSPALTPFMFPKHISLSNQFGRHLQH